MIVPYVRQKMRASKPFPFSHIPPPSFPRRSFFSTFTSRRTHGRVVESGSHGLGHTLVAELGPSVHEAATPFATALAPTVPLGPMLGLGLQIQSLHRPQFLQKPPNLFEQAPCTPCTCKTSIRARSLFQDRDRATTRERRWHWALTLSGVICGGRRPMYTTPAFSCAFEDSSSAICPSA